ncbi:acylphosphatase [Planctomycetota bacterium]
MRQKTIFKGHVQGVGFRYTAASIATHFLVTGYVRNLPDGAVELVAEGERAEVEGLIADIKERIGLNIRSVLEVSEPETGSFPDFKIKH